MAGWIKLFRDLKSHWLWNLKEPFDKRSAFIDLLLNVNYISNTVVLNGSKIVVGRGQMITSIQKLADKWIWSRHKVSNYLNRLEQENMIIQVRDSKKILIGITNYEFYQNNQKTRKCRGYTRGHKFK